MSDPDDLMARGRAIFERLRTAEIERQGVGDDQDDATDAPAYGPEPASGEPHLGEPTDEEPAVPDSESELDEAPPSVTPMLGSEDGGAGDDHTPETSIVGTGADESRGSEDDHASDQGVHREQPAQTSVDAAAADAAAEPALAKPGTRAEPGPEWEPAASERDPDGGADDGHPASHVEASLQVGTSPAPPRADPVAAPPELDDLLEETAVDERPPTRAASSPFARDLPRILAIANQKGGVGKTTTAVNLGACLADLGYRVLVIDLDPQGNASTGLGINIRALQASMYDVIINEFPLEDCVEATTVRNLFVAPASLDLAGAEIELVPAFSRELKLRRALEDVVDDYDFVLIDCPPSLGLLTVNGLAAAGEVLVPIQCEYYALEGLGQLLRNVNLVQKNLNARLELSAIVLVMYDARTKLADQVVREVRSHFGDKVCRNIIPRTVRLSEAPSFGQPIIAFDSSSRGAIAYRELAKEVSGGTPQRAR